MRVKHYLQDLLGKIADNPYVESQTISFEERPPNAAYLNGVIIFLDGSRLHLKEFIIKKSNFPHILKYGYNYLTEDGTLIFRYDNAFDPKARKLSTFPEHKHRRGGLTPRNRPLLEEIFREISVYIRKKIEELSDSNS